jgi:hypothetical protein
VGSQQGLPHKVRERIQTSMLINRSQNHALGHGVLSFDHG